MAALNEAEAKAELVVRLDGEVMAERAATAAARRQRKQAETDVMASQVYYRLGGTEGAQHGQIHSADWVASQLPNSCTAELQQHLGELREHRDTQLSRHLNQHMSRTTTESTLRWRKGPHGTVLHAVEMNKLA